MTELTHKSERKECERELKVMPGRWWVAYKNGRYEFRLSIVPWRHYFVIQYRSTKPKGWVIFEAKIDEKGARSPRGRLWCARRKASDVSYPSPGAAAVAGTVANLFPVGD